MGGVDWNVFPADRQLLRRKKEKAVQTLLLSWTSHPERNAGREQGIHLNCSNQVSQIGWFKRRNLYTNTVLETWSPSSGCQQCWFPLRAVREGSVPFWLLTKVTVFTWPCILYIALYTACVQTSPVYEDTSQTGLGPHLTPLNQYLHWPSSQRKSQ